MRKSKWLVWSLVLALVFVTAACSKKDPAPSASGGTGTGGKDAPKTEQQGKPDTVKVWTYPVHAKYEDDLKDLIKDFNAKYPNIKVEYEMLSWAEGPKKFDVALNAGDPPDLYFHAVSGQYVSTGLALQLDQYLTPEIKGDYLPGTLDLAKIQGKQYGLPLYQFQWGWGGNKRILEEAGVDWKKIQQQGWTWSEFAEIAKKLTKKLPDGSMQYGLVTDGNGANNDFIQLVTRNSGLDDVVDKDGKFIWNDDRILDSLKFIDGLMKSGVMPKETAALAAQKRTDMFYAGQAAIISKAIPYYDVMIANRNKDIDAGKVKGEKIDYIQLPVPHNDKYPAKTTSGAEGYVAFKQKNDKGEEHAKNTFLVMEALSGAKAGNSANELCLPFVRQSQAKLFEGKGLAQPYNKAAAEAMAKSVAMPVDLTISADTSAKVKQYYEQVVKPGVQALFTGSKTPDQLADEFKSKGKQILGQ
ncbi:sugar ABC transporter substrate-binding protein [Gordoniibacillus kamchatkensis]|uniref:Sugar ABC transporter substrate-binding protein n=1 Tax=Gordoniibacillus kamchatkensis TaxID=1590651 RepID=A0ABR5ANI3_9BACL|nr:extracellular solute-binding protein [Paenibacillus sp. VKM B-2647]KIL42393.1 sugar ABC transporter substrate-binding protein [Paenibacillus sp. VKM B-2647]